MLKRIDFYIIRKFLGTYIFAIALIIAIAVVFDFNEKLDKFISKDAPVKAIIFDYYMNFIPYFVNLFSQLFTFIAVIFFTSKLADNSEIIAMLSSGISFKRLMVPYMIAAAIIAGTTFYLNGFVIPPANEIRNEFQNKYIKNKKEDNVYNIQFMVEPGVVAYIYYYNSKTNIGNKFSMERFDGKTLKSSITAQSVKYKEDHKWELKNYLIREIDGKRQKISKGASLDTIILMQPSDFMITQYDQETMTTPQLKQYIDQQKKRGVANIVSFEIEYHQRFAAIIASFILTSIGMSVASRKIKGGMGLNIGIGLALSFSYILFMKVSSTFAINGKMSPFMAVWIPNFVYIIIALFLYKRAPK